MFRELIADIERGEVDCVVVKDLSRLGRDHIAVGYYLEVFFPMNCVRFVSINDDFDTVNGLTDQSHPHGARIRIPIKNAFNEQVAVEIKQKVEATLQMKIERQVKITSNQTRAKFYVACTRAKHSIVFAIENPCENVVFKATDIHFSDKSIPAYKFSKPDSDI